MRTAGDPKGDALLPKRRGSRVLFTADSFLPHAGGSRVYYYNLCSHWTQQFPDSITVLTREVPGWEEFDRTVVSSQLRIIRRGYPLPNWKYHQLPKIAGPLTSLLWLWKSADFDVVHAGDLFPQGVAALLAKRVARVPYIAYCHGEEITQMDRRRFQPVMRDAVYRGADAVVAANEFARANLLRIGVPAERIGKVLPGVDHERFAPRPKNPELMQRFGLAGKTVVLSVGRLVARKGHAQIMRALAGMHLPASSFHYLIAGEGPEKEALLKLAQELRIAGSVTLAGKVPEEQLAEYYNLCDLFALANRDVDGDLEGFGMVFLEANAAGKPTLGGRTGGTSEAVLENLTGMLVDPEDVLELTDALGTLLSNPELRHRLGNAGLRRVRTEFSWQEQARRLCELNCAVVERSRRTRPLGSRRDEPLPQFLPSAHRVSQQRNSD